MKTYYINDKEVTREIFILKIVKAISDKEPSNTLELRNNIYSEVNKFIGYKEKQPDNFTLALDFENQFHIIEKENSKSVQKNV